MPTKDEYIEKLNLTPHPEGGWYRQVYHSAKTRYDETSVDGSLKMYENGNLKLYIFVHFFVYSLKKLEVMYT